MLLTRHTHERPWAPDRFNKMMDEFFASENQATGLWAPSVDVKETDKELTFTVEVPGMELKDLTVELCGDTLNIGGTRERSKEDRKEDYVRTERCYGAFQRSFTLDVPVNADGIQATCKSGVLTVTVPKTGARSSKTIPVKEG